MTTRLVRTLALFYDRDGFFLAAGLSFFVVVCLVPFVLLLVAGGGFLLTDERALEAVLDRLAIILPVYHSEMRQLLLGVVEARRVSSLVGTLVLVFFAVQLFAATRYVLDRMLGVKGRGFLHGTLLDLVMMVVLTALFFVSVAVTAAFAWTRTAVLGLGWGFLVTTLLGWAGLGLAVGLNGVLFAVLYRFVPSVRAPWPVVLAASATTGLLWEVAKQVFRLYIQDVGVYSAFYGSLGVTIALVMWVYYSAVVFVLGVALVRRLWEERGDLPAG